MGVSLRHQDVKRGRDESCIFTDSKQQQRLLPQPPPPPPLLLLPVLIHGSHEDEDHGMDRFFSRSSSHRPESMSPFRDHLLRLCMHINFAPSFASLSHFSLYLHQKGCSFFTQKARRKKLCLEMIGEDVREEKKEERKANEALSRHKRWEELHE